MWNNTVASKSNDSNIYFTHALDQLPLEILHRIFYYLDIPDILRVRTVCRYLNQVSRGRGIWSDAYRKADLVRPPGPYPSQSARELENVLVSSFRVELNFRETTRTAESTTRKLREIQDRRVVLRANLVLTRFLFVAFSEEVRCYDLNSSNSDASIVYRPTGGTLKSFHCVSAIDIKGRPFACVVLSEEVQATARISLCLVNVGEQSEVTLELLLYFEHGVFEVDTVDLGPRVIVIQGHGADRGVDRRFIAFDVYTRTLLLLPFVFPATWKEAGVPEFEATVRTLRPTSISTSTHLFLAYTISTPSEWMVFIQAFALPPPEKHRQSASTTLSLSHSGVIPGIYIGKTALLHDSVCDPTTQGVLIAIRVYAYEPPFGALLKHGLLRLSTAHSPPDHDPEVGTITFQLQGLITNSYPPFLHPSWNGTGRVFDTLNTGSGCVIVALEYDLHVRGEHGARVIEYPHVLRFPTSRMLWDYDPYVGRICLGRTTAERYIIEVFDLAM